MTKPKIGFKAIPIERTGSLALNRAPAKAKWDGTPKRAPRKGEYYISGASGYEVAYLAHSDMSSEYFIAVPIETK